MIYVNIFFAENVWPHQNAVGNKATIRKSTSHQQIYDQGQYNGDKSIVFPFKPL